MGIFSSLYNKVAKFFRPQDESDVNASKEVATNRLKLVLMQDRTNLTPKVLEQMRGELVDLLSKYLELDKDLLELNFEQEGDQVALMLSIPVIRAKDEEEIEAALALLDDADNVEITEEGSDSEVSSEANDSCDAVEMSENSENITDSISDENSSDNSAQESLSKVSAPIEKTPKKENSAETEEVSK